jgi:hypothetical protein
MATVSLLGCRRNNVADDGCPGECEAEGTHASRRSNLLQDRQLSSLLRALGRCRAMTEMSRLEPTDRRPANGRTRRNLAVRPRSGEGQESTRPGSSFSSREGPVCDQEELFLE